MIACAGRRRTRRVRRICFSIAGSDEIHPGHGSPSGFRDHEIKAVACRNGTAPWEFLPTNIPCGGCAGSGARAAAFAHYSVHTDATEAQFLRPQAPCPMPRRYLLQLRHLLPASLGGVAAARMKRAAWGRIGRVGHIALQHDPFCPAARGVVALSIGLAIYDIYRAPDHGREALHRGALAGAGLDGSLLIGAVGTSLVCEPGAPVCAAVFALVGGVAFTLGANYWWQRLGP